MPNIAFVHSVNVLGGAERMSEAIIAGLPDKDYNFSLISPEPGALSETFAKYGAKNYFCPLFQPAIKHPILTWQHQRRCTELLTSAKIDVLHTGDLLCVRSFSRAASNCNIPLVCHVHFPVEAPFVAWVFNKMPAPAAFVFCSQELQNSSGPILAKYCPNTAQYVIHNGVNIDYFAPVPASGSRQSTDMASLKHIGIVANLQFRKGHDDFIQMAKEVLKTHQNVHFDIIGGDILQEPREGILKQQIAELGIEPHFTFHGQLADVRDAIRKLDIYVCASHQEAFPVSILEAMACQKAIVSTNVNGIPEALHDGDNALLIEPHQPLQMAAAVIKLLEQPELAAKISKNARNHVVDKFCLEQYCEKFKQLYASLYQENNHTKKSL